MEPSDGFLRTARERLPAAIALHRGDATRIPLGDATVDVVVSGLVLNFVADQNAALREMARVTVGDGTEAAYVWDYAEGMQLIRYFWEVAVEIEPGAAPLNEGVRFPSCRPEVLAELFARAGLGDVEVMEIDVTTPFESFDAAMVGRTTPGCTAGRRRRRLCTSPRRARRSATVLGAGHARISAWRSCSTRSSFRAPRCGCAWRASTSSSVIRSAVRCGQRCGARLRSTRPCRPSAS